MNRRRFGLALAGLALVYAAPASALDAGDRTIVPGLRVGALVRTTPPADIGKIYGAATTRYGKVSAAEGAEVPGATVLAGTDAELQIGFTEDGKRIEFIRIIGKAWATKDGIRIGAPLALLERLNGGPFQLYGFEWDYGGTVLGSAKGKLPKGLFITVAPTRTVSERERNQVMGDRKISSRHPALAKMGVVVSTLGIAWPQ